MKKNIKHFVCFILLLIGTLGSQIFAVESEFKNAQDQEKQIISRYKNKGLFVDGRDEEGKIKFKNKQGRIVWSSEHLDPQRAKPSPESALWLAHHYTDRKYEDPKIVFDYKVVSPSGTLGLIMGIFKKDDAFIIGDNSNSSNDPMDEPTRARALDLALDHFSGYMDLDFKNFKIVVPGVASQYPVLKTAIQELVLEEREKKCSASQSIESKFNDLNNGTIKECYNPLITLMRRVNHTKMDLEAQDINVD